jgi:hypothetical protein
MCQNPLLLALTIIKLFEIGRRRRKLRALAGLF